MLHVKPLLLCVNNMNFTNKSEKNTKDDKAHLWFMSVAVIFILLSIVFHLFELDKLSGFFFFIGWLVIVCGALRFWLIYLFFRKK